MPKIVSGFCFITGGPTGGIARSRGYRRAVMYRLILKAIQRQSFAAGLT